MKKGTIKLVLGCMFSGKTRFIMDVGEKYVRAGQKVIYLRLEDDNRYSAERKGRKALLCSHDGKQQQAFPVKNLKELPTETMDACIEADVIIIDEGQFMENLVEFCTDMVETFDKYIVISALDGTFQKTPFSQISELIPKCEKLVKLHSICIECGARASFTRKIGGDMSKIVEIGGSNEYVPTCRAHHVGPLSPDMLQRRQQIETTIKQGKRL